MRLTVAALAFALVWLVQTQAARATVVGPTNTVDSTDGDASRGGDSDAAEPGAPERPAWCARPAVTPPPPPPPEPFAGGLCVRGINDEDCRAQDPAAPGTPGGQAGTLASPQAIVPDAPAPPPPLQGVAPLALDVTGAPRPGFTTLPFRPPRTSR